MPAERGLSRPPINDLVRDLQNGQNNPKNRKIALEIIMQGEVRPTTVKRLMKPIEEGWRREGEDPEGKLDKEKLEEITPQVIDNPQ